MGLEGIDPSTFRFCGRMLCQLSYRPDESDVQMIGSITYSSDSFASLLAHAIHHYLLKNTSEALWLQRSGAMVPPTNLLVNYLLPTVDPLWRYTSGMLTHHIQRHIVRTLSHHNSLSFSELRPGGIENKLFDYHLKATIREGFVEKVDNGYRLTLAGQKLWRRMSETHTQIAERALSVLYLIVKDQARGWLLYRRRTHPHQGKVAFMHGTPLAGVEVTKRASSELEQKTGLRGSFSVVGSGFFHSIDTTGNIISFVNFTALECRRPSGTLQHLDETADYFWAKDIVDNGELLPNMQALLAAIAAPARPFFIEQILQPLA